MAQYKVLISGVNTAKLPLLKDKDAFELFKEISRGNDCAREKYIIGNLRLVLSIVGRFACSGDDASDLFQIGCIGLMKAIDNFDITREVKFSTYAVPMILGEIRRYLRDNSLVRVSRSVKDIAFKAMASRDKLWKQLGREPEIGEISSDIEMPAEDIIYALDAVQSPVSLYDPVYSDNGDTLYIMDQVKDNSNNEESWVNNIEIKEAINRLNPREKRVIDLRYNYGKTQMEVARMINISQAQVSRLEKNALKSMREYLS